MTAARSAARPPSAYLIVPALGVTQILAWGSSFYLPAVLAKPMADQTGWGLTWTVGSLSLALLIAGLVSPLVGRKIHALGGKPVLMSSALLLSTGLTLLAAAPNLAIFVAGWVVLGLGMGAGLYDAAFATLGRLYGLTARRHITSLTLFGGLASTACWPLSAFLLSRFGWRGTCAAYAAVQLMVSLPIYLFALKGTPSQALAPVEMRDGRKLVEPRAVGHTALFPLLAAVITIASMLSTFVSVYLLDILQSRGIALAGAVALGTWVGPSQVSSRFIELLVSRYHHPVWTQLGSVVFLALGLWLLWIRIPFVPLCLMCYGAGLGLESIARATLPLALFGAGAYAPLMGRLARPSLIAMAATPTLGALLIQEIGTEATMAAIALVAVVNVGLVGILFIRVNGVEKRAAGVGLV